MTGQQTSAGRPIQEPDKVKELPLLGITVYSIVTWTFSAICTTTWVILGIGIDVGRLTYLVTAFRGPFVYLSTTTTTDLPFDLILQLLTGFLMVLFCSRFGQHFYEGGTDEGISMDGRRLVVRLDGHLICDQCVPSYLIPNISWRLDLLANWETWRWAVLG